MEKFYPAGKVIRAGIAKTVPAFSLRKQRRTSAKRRGIKYEQKAQAMLVEKYSTYIPSLWLQFYSKSSSSMRWCQPDGVLFDFKRGIITIIEIKFCHTAQAWWQLNELYLPVISHIFGRELWNYRLAEMVLWYDSVINFPGEHYLRKDLHNVREGEVGIHIWKPSKYKKPILMKL